MSRIQVAALSSALLLFLAGCSHPRELKSEAQRRAAPNFTLKDADGNPVNLTDYRGKVVLVNFWATWCGPCMAELPYERELVEQYEKMVQAFESKCAALQKSFSLPLNLSLKVIAHYGPMSEYTIGSFKKLYGKVVVEAHRLLKNSIERDCYLLLTDSLVKMTGAIAADELLHYGIRANKLCEIYGSLRNICFTYFDFCDDGVLKQVA